MLYSRFLIVISVLSFLTLVTAFTVQTDDLVFVASTQTPNPRSNDLIPVGKFAVSNLLGENIRVVSHGVGSVSLSTRAAKTIGLPLGKAQQTIQVSVSGRSFSIPIRQCFRYTILRDNGVLKCKESL